MNPLTKAKEEKISFLAIFPSVLIIGHLEKYE